MKNWKIKNHSAQILVQMYVKFFFTIRLSAWILNQFLYLKIIFFLLVSYLVLPYFICFEMQKKKLTSFDCFEARHLGPKFCLIVIFEGWLWLECLFLECAWIFVHVEFVCFEFCLCWIFIFAMGFVLVDRTNGRMPLVWICLKTDKLMFPCFHDVLWLLIMVVKSFEWLENKIILFWAYGYS